MKINLNSQKIQDLKLNLYVSISQVEKEHP